MFASSFNKEQDVPGQSPHLLQKVASDISSIRVQVKRRAIALVAACVVLYTLYLGTYSPSPFHPIGHIKSSTYGYQTPKRTGQSFLPLREAEELCRTHEFEVYPERNEHRKIYDLFLIGTELDWLEIRLGTLVHSPQYFPN